MVPNEYNLKQVLPAVAQFTDTARSGVLPPNTAAAYPWLEKTSGGSDPVYGGYYMASGAQVLKQQPDNNTIGSECRHR